MPHGYIYTSSPTTTRGQIKYLFNEWHRIGILPCVWISACLLLDWRLGCEKSVHKRKQHTPSPSEMVVGSSRSKRLTIWGKGCVFAELTLLSFDWDIKCKVTTSNLKKSLSFCFVSGKSVDQYFIFNHRETTQKQTHQPTGFKRSFNCPLIPGFVLIFSLTPPRFHLSPGSNLQWPINLTCTPLGCGRKPEENLGGHSENLQDPSQVPVREWSTCCATVAPISGYLAHCWLWDPAVWKLAIASDS